MAATAAGLLARRGERLTCFTSVPRPGFDAALYPARYVTVEREGAAAVAAAYGNVDHQLIDSAGYRLMATMRRWVDAMGEPVLNAVNVLWITAIFDRARELGVKVMLQGSMGNATISWTSQNVLSEYLRTGRLMELARTAWTLRRNGGTSFRDAAAGALHGLAPHWLTRRVAHPVRQADATRTALHPLLVAKYAAKLSPDYFRGDAKAQRMQFFRMADDASVRQTVAALWGIDVRDPTDDRRVWEFCCGIPPEQFVVGGHTRSLVRRAMLGRVPDAVRLNYRLGLQGADWWVPVGEDLPAMREELALQEKSPAANAVVDLAKLKRLLESWPAGGYEQRETTQSWNYALTRGLTMGYFLRSWEERA